MRERIQFLLIYFSFWVVFFITARLIFLGYHIEDTKLLTVQTVGGIFYYGIQMDLSMAGYLCVIPFGLVAASNFIKKSRLENWIFSYTFLMVILFTFFIVTDLQVFNTWGYRLDTTPFIYIKSTGDAWASVKSSPILQLFISFLLLIAVASYIVYRIITKNIDNWNHIENIPMMPVIVLFVLVLIIPIRGGIQKNPIGQNSVYFSENNFANIAAINAPWNLFSSIISNTFDKVNPYTYLPKEELESIINKLFKSTEHTEFVINKDVQKPNVLLIMVEGISSKQLSQVVGGGVSAEESITPNLNQMAKEGVYFSNFYASSDRTIKTLPAVLSGYPSPPKGSILDSPNKTSKLPILSKEFEQNGYSTTFHYGGNLELDNLKSYLYGGYFQKIVSKSDFDKSEESSKWGVHDEAVFKRLSQDLSQLKEPFFSTILTLSTREPYTIPMVGHFKGKSEQTKFINAVYYTDKVLGEFITFAKKQSWWKNTLVIITSNKGNGIPSNNSLESNNMVQNFKIPMFWLGGILEKKGLLINKVCTQTDLSSTVLHQLNMNAQPFNFSKNIFDKKTGDWAYFTFSEGFGFIEPQNQLIFDNVSNKLIFQQGNAKQERINLGKALEQRTYQDYLDK